MKTSTKLIIGCVIYLLLMGILLGNSLAGYRTIEWNKYLGKNVKVTTFKAEIYEGKVTWVNEFETCLQRDVENNCVYKDYRYVIYLINGQNTISIDCDRIVSVEENGR